MLSIGKLGAGQEAYYTAKVAEGAEDYYSGRGEAEGYWLGSAAVELGLHGKVDADALTAMLTGRHPATGEPLGLRHVAGRGPVPGFDLTFSAPKSVSLAWAFGGEGAGAEVVEAHRASVAAALDYIEREACWTRRGHGGREFVHSNGFIAAAYRHRSSRAGDPQLHTHVLVANATRGPDGRWTRLYHPAIYDHAKTAGYIYEANLRHELTRRLGVRWREVANGIAEIEGFDPEHLRAFSTRRAEILAATAPDASARALQIATLTTRKAKDRDLTEESLRERWCSTAEAIGLDRETIRRTFGREQEASRETVDASVVETALTSRASHFDRRDAIQAVADQLRSGAPAAEVEALADAFLARDSIVAVGQSAKGPRFTTERVWGIERDALASAREMAASDGHAVVAEIAVARVLAARSTIKADQRLMVERLTRGGEQIVVVIGEAGTGKTFAAEAWAGAGVGLRVAAPTWRAANVLRSEGLDATSVARLLAELDGGRGRLARNSVLLVDEAGMVDSATLARLIDHARAADAKLVLVGDPAQLGEIEAGGLFAAIVARTEPVVLDQVVRHEYNIDREGARRIRDGHGAEAIEVYRSAERVVVSADPESRREAMVADWWRSFAEGKDAVMVAKRNVEVERLNALARELMKAEGRLGDAEIAVGDDRFAVGDQVITRVNDHRAGIYNRERWQVDAIDSDGVDLVGVDTDRRVTVGADYLGRENQKDGAPALQHAYAATTYQAQGSTVDRAYVMADPSMDRQELYVAASRSREETWFYATPEVDLEREEYAPHSPGREGLVHIAAAAERDGAQVSAHDQALRSRLEPLSSPDLVRLRDELRSEAGAEAQGERRREDLDERITHSEELLAGVETERRELGEPPQWGRDAKRAHEDACRRLDARESMSRDALARHEAERARLPEIAHDARAEVAAIDRILDRRADMALAAARVSPADHLVAELGERPEEGPGRVAWDRAVREVEGYRDRNGVVDREDALGAEPKDRVRRHEQVTAKRAIEQARHSLGLEQTRAAERSQTIEIGL
jgi:conjugative relaxase-like TrwC/TraI family protein